ncbi:MAG: DUF1800 domain-containing protein [Acidobacteriia bacterium]|nr:DUF1800 domain-containing protein [Terriglobia bacterium]
MGFARRKLGLVLALSLLGLALAAPFALGKKKEKQNSAGQMDEQKRALHALNRLTFGPRAGDVERVTATGVDRWIDEQLHPEKINDSALDTRLAPLRTLRMDTREIVENFPPPQLIKAVEQGKQSLPSDPVKRAVYQDQIERMQEKQDRKQEAASADPPAADAGKNKLTDEERARRREDRLYADLKAQELLDMPPDQRMKEILKMSPEDRRALTASLKGAKRDEFIEGMTPQQRETLMALDHPQLVVPLELMQAKLLRGTYSQRQLQEVMTDFWFNHFNVFIGKGADRYLITSYERDVIRPHAMGKFEDLLVATAQSPAMLFYLDNWLSVGPNSDIANGVPRSANKAWRKRSNQKNASTKQSKGKRSGLNENYGRELMELHTLGVNGGYTQSDVTEVARVFTGWTLKQPRQGGDFTFEERMHEPGDKTVLGHRIKPAGEKEGLEVLHLLAHNPSTARFISTKLAMRFVSDNPPPALVDRMSQTFLKKDGDIREVLKTLFQSPEFWSPEAYRAKVKTPLEFVVSALRASDAEITDAAPIARQLQAMGMPLYGMQPPTGYSMKAETWVNSSALLGRMNFALALTAGKLKGVQVASDRVLGAASPPPDPQLTLALLENNLLAGGVSRQTHDTIAAQLKDPKISGRQLDDPARPPNVAVIAGLILGSPEFQRR